ncbi:MAG: CopG family transcriptional regulator [Verrucomicrobiaceae bacterium]|nr:CopG family transcriptional regulator [Verrucomicrobiaceae bacterium]
MSTLTVKLPDSTLRVIRQLARREGVSVNQFMSSAASEKVAAWQTADFLKQEAAQSTRADFLKFLDAAPDTPPVKTDRM